MIVSRDMSSWELVPGKELPLILIAQFANKELVTYYEECLSPDLHKELAVTAVEFPKIEHLLDVLRSHPI